MTMRQSFLWAFVLIGLGVVGYRWFSDSRPKSEIQKTTATAVEAVRRGSTPASPIDEQGSTPAQSSNASGATMQAVVERPTKDFPPSSLPPLNALLVQVYDQLVREANSGNYRASCRLAFELDRCGTLPIVLRNLEAIKLAGASMKPESPEAIANKNRQHNEESTIRQEQQVCEGFVDKDGIAPWQYSYAAAVQGHVPSMARFAISPPMNPLDFVSNLDGWTVYKATASDLLHQAASAGDMSAVFVLAREYSSDIVDDGYGLGGVRLAAQTDLFRSAVYTYAARSFPQFRDSRRLQILLGSLGSKLSAGDMARAQSEAASMVANWPVRQLEPKDSRVPGQTLPIAGMDCLE